MNNMEKITAKELIGKEFTILDYKEGESKFGKYLYIHVNFDGKEYLWFSSSKSIKDTIEKLDTSKPVKVILEEHTSKTDRRYLTIRRAE